MLKGYKKHCEEFIVKWIDEKTRLKSQDIAFQGYKEYSVNFKVELKTAFKVLNGGQNEADKVLKKPFKDMDFKLKKYYSRGEYESAVDKFDGKEYFGRLCKLIEKGNYACCAAYPIFLLGKERLECSYKCYICDGKGKRSCDCNNGLMECDVWGCKNGRVKCSAWGCDKGQVKKSNYKNGQTIKYFEPCGKCKGVGFVTCSKCRGTATVTCSKCGGSTIVRCICNRGILTDFTNIYSVAETNFETIYPSDFDKKLKTALNKIAEANFSQIAKIKRVEFNILDTEKAVFERYEVSIPVAEFNIIIKNKTYPFKVYGKDVRMLENGNIPLKDNFYRAIVSVLAVVAVVAFTCYIYIVTSPQNSSPKVELGDNKPQQNTIKLSIPKGSYVNLRKSPNGEIISKIYAKDLDKITLEKLDGGDEKWIKVLYFPPSVTDEKNAIIGYIHSSKIDKNSLQK